MTKETYVTFSSGRKDGKGMEISISSTVKGIGSLDLWLRFINYLEEDDNFMSAQDLENVECNVCAKKIHEAKMWRDYDGKFRCEIHHKVKKK